MHAYMHACICSKIKQNTKKAEKEKKKTPYNYNGGVINEISNCKLLAPIVLTSNYGVEALFV